MTRTRTWPLVPEFIELLERYTPPTPAREMICRSSSGYRTCCGKQGWRYWSTAGSSSPPPGGQDVEGPPGRLGTPWSHRVRHGRPPVAAAATSIPRMLRWPARSVSRASYAPATTIAALTGLDQGSFRSAVKLTARMAEPRQARRRDWPGEELAVVALYALWLNDRRRRTEEARHELEGEKARMAC